MPEEPTKKHRPDRAGKSQYASSAVKQELERIERQAMPSSAGLAGSNALASPLSPENVVRAVLGEPHRGDKPKNGKRSSVHDWPVATPGR
jgi:hypothetical protein